MADQTWTADRRLYLDKDGKVVEADNPAKATLLVGAGGSIPIARAQALGLIGADGQVLGAGPDGAAQPGSAPNAGQPGPDDPDGAFAYLGEAKDGGESGSPAKRRPDNKAARPTEDK